MKRYVRSKAIIELARVTTRRTRGQSMVELALILPFLVLITMGTIEFAYYIYTYSELENATRRASEYASKTPPLNPANANDPCGILAKQDAINGFFLSNLKPADISFRFVGSRQVGDQVEAQITYQGQWLTPIGKRFGNMMNFQFKTRRTILSLEPPLGYSPTCQ